MKAGGENGEKFSPDKYFQPYGIINTPVNTYLAGYRQKVPAITRRQDDDVMDQPPCHTLTEVLGEGGEGGVRIQRLEKVFLTLLLFLFLLVLVLLTRGGVFGVL